MCSVPLLHPWLSILFRKQSTSLHQTIPGWHRSKTLVPKLCSVQQKCHNLGINHWIFKTNITRKYFSFWKMTQSLSIIQQYCVACRSLRGKHQKFETHLELLSFCRARVDHTLDRYLRSTEQSLQSRHPSTKTKITRNSALKSISFNDAT